MERLAKVLEFPEVLTEGAWIERTGAGDELKHSVRCLAESHRHSPPALLPQPDARKMAGLEAAIAEIESSLEGADRKRILSAIAMIAERKDVDPPPKVCLDMDAACLAEIPADLFEVAFRRLWRGFRWPRLPEVADWEDQIRDEWQDRREELLRLRQLRKKWLDLSRARPPKLTQSSPALTSNRGGSLSASQ